MLFVLVPVLLALALWGSMAALRARRLARELHSQRQQLERYEQWLPWVLSVTKLVTWEADPTTGAVSAGPVQAYRFPDGTPEPLSMEHFAAALHPEDRPRFLESARKLSEENAPFDVELRVIGPNGAVGYVHSMAVACRDAQGRPTRILGITEDITARRTTELELQKAKERLTRAVHGSSDGLFDIDMVSGEMWWDGFLERELGYDKNEIPQTIVDFSALIHPDDQPARKTAFEKYLQGEVPLYELDYRARTKAGTWKWFHVRGQADFDASGKPVRLSGMTQDVTEKKRYQQALIEATEAAAAANRAKSEFLANMSHEIRTPMNGVIGMSALLLETKLDAMQRDYAETIRSSGAALLTIINDILDFSKVEAGKLELGQVDVDLRETFHDVARLLAVQAHAKGLEITVHIDARLPDVVKGDPGRLRQILLNLGGNAVKFTERGAVSIDLQVLESDDRGTLVRCEVRDTGIGIPTDRIGSLFQPFTQVDASTTRKFGGSGLGLSIVKRLTELMGGQTGTESQEGIGSMFWFTARLGPADQSIKPARPNAATSVGTTDALQSHRAHSRGRILLAEDNTINQRVTSLMVEKLGFRIDIAVNGAEAVSAWSTGRYDAILMDCQMPVMDGYAATREIRRLERGLRHIPIVALTAHAMKGADEQCRLAGMDDYLTKPIDRALLETALKHHVSETRTQDAVHAPATDLPVDWEALIDATDHDGDLIQELATLFIGSSDASLAAISRAIEAADFDAVGRKAHEIRGASANLYAQSLSSTAAEIEAAVAAGQYDQIAPLAEVLTRELVRTVDYLRAKTVPESNRRSEA